MFGSYCSLNSTIELAHKTGTGEEIVRGVFDKQVDLAPTTVEGVAITGTELAHGVDVVNASVRQGDWRGTVNDVLRDLCYKTHGQGNQLSR